MALESINPATGEFIKSFPELNEEEISKIIDAGNETFLTWRETSFAERSKLMNEAAKVLRDKKNEYARGITTEMGKPIKQAVGEVEKCAWVCEYYAENAEKFLSKEFIETDAAESYVQFDPIGVVLAVMPWNFPFWQVFRFAAPSIMAGNVGLLKHASNVPMTANAIEDVFRLAGFPENVFKNLMIGSSKVKSVITNPKVKAATLTGSEPAGSKVAELSGKLIKKTVLELGGSDPFIILSDANLDKAVDTAVTARLINNGESCIAAKRFIVVEDIADEFTKRFVEKFKNLNVGDPMEEDTDLGPLAREDLVTDLNDQVSASVDYGAKVLIGGKRIERPGYYYEPTIITDLTPKMRAYKEELFGPVAALFIAKDEEDAIRIANDTDFGLGASLWTSDLEKAKRLVTKIHSGSTFINELVKSDPRLPFGGVGVSGYGRELSHYGIKEFVNIKTVYVNKAD